MTWTEWEAQLSKLLFLPSEYGGITKCNGWYELFSCQPFMKKAELIFNFISLGSLWALFHSTQEHVGPADSRPEYTSGRTDSPERPFRCFDEWVLKVCVYLAQTFWTKLTWSYRIFRAFASLFGNNKYVEHNIIIRGQIDVWGQVYFGEESINKSTKNTKADNAANGLQSCALDIDTDPQSQLSVSKENYYVRAFLQMILLCNRTFGLATGVDFCNCLLTFVMVLLYLCKNTCLFVCLFVDVCCVPASRLDSCKRVLLLHQNVWERQAGVWRLPRTQQWAASQLASLPQAVSWPIQKFTKPNEIRSPKVQKAEWNQKSKSTPSLKKSETAINFFSLLPLLLCNLCWTVSSKHILIISFVPSVLIVSDRADCIPFFTFCLDDHFPISS